MPDSTISIAVDPTPAQQGARVVKAALDDVAASADKAKASVAGVGDQFERHNVSASDFAAALKAAGGDLKKVNLEAVGASAATKQASDAQASLSGAAKAAATSQTTLSGATKQSADSLKGATVAHKDHTAATNESSKATASAGVNIDQMVLRWNRLTHALLGAGLITGIIHEIGTSIGDAAGGFREAERLNIPFQQMQGFAYALASVGGKAEDAAPILERLHLTMRQAILTGNEFGYALNQLGISLTDNQGRMRSELDIVRQLAAIWPSLTPSDRNAFANMFTGGGQAAAEMIRVLNQGPAAMDQMIASGMRLSDQMGKSAADVDASFTRIVRDLRTLLETGVIAIVDWLRSIRDEADKILQWDPTTRSFQNPAAKAFRSYMQSGEQPSTITGTPEYQEQYDRLEKFYHGLGRHGYYLADRPEVPEVGSQPGAAGGAGTGAGAGRTNDLGSVTPSIQLSFLIRLEQQTAEQVRTQTELARAYGASTEAANAYKTAEDTLLRARQSGIILTDKQKDDVRGYADQLARLRTVTEAAASASRLLAESNPAEAARRQAETLGLQLDRARGAGLDPARLAALGEEQQRQTLYAQNTPYAGLTLALNDYERQSRNVAKNVEGFFTSSFDAMGNALASFATTGKMNWGSLASTILSDLIRMETRQLFGTVLRAAGFGAPTIPSTPYIMTPYMHSGGVVGLGGTMRMVDMGLFANAPRFESGGMVPLKPGEVPIIAHAGETVIPAGQSAGGQQMTFHMDFRGSNGSEELDRKVSVGVIHAITVAGKQAPGIVASYNRRMA